MVYKGILLDKNLQNPKDVAVKTVHGKLKKITNLNTMNETQHVEDFTFYVLLK